MFPEITIENYRGFRQFRLPQLGQVNLLVGTNNSGKTSILEAIELLASRGDPKTLWHTMFRRGEQLWHDEDKRRETEVDISHLFFGHDFDLGSSFAISSGANHDDFVKIDVRERNTKEGQGTLFDPESSEEYPGPFVLGLTCQGVDRATFEMFPLTGRGGLPSNVIFRPARVRRTDRSVQFISTAAMTVEQVVSLFDDIVLTHEEELVVEALQTIDPAIERIAGVATAHRRSYFTRGGIVVKCKDIGSRIPIGSMGDGIWRILGLALALVSAENGVLLVDEIDTGLHYTAMSDMWKLVKKTADRLKVQVFATTHSRDCYESFAEIARSTVTSESQVTIQRIEKGKNKAVAFTEREIVIAAERGLEVR